MSRELDPWLVGRTMSKLCVHRWVLGAHVGPPRSRVRVTGAKLFLQGRRAQKSEEGVPLSLGR